MTAAHIFEPENRLAQALSQIESVSSAALVGAAEARVGGMREAVTGYVLAKLVLLQPYAAMGEADLFANCRALSAAALDIAEVAAVAGLEAVGEAARGVVAMIEALIGQGVWHTDALRLHLDSIALLAGSRTPAETEAVLTRLRTMRTAIGVAE